MTKRVNAAGRRIGVLLTAALALGTLTYCAAPPAKRVAVPSSPPGQAVVPEAVKAAADSRPLYRVLSSESLMTIRVYRGGPMARVGHNHVIASHNLAGEIRLGDPLAFSSGWLRVPVALLTVDEPALRAAAGPDYAADVPDSAREATRRNLLSDALLDAERFPGIEVRSLALEQKEGLLQLRLQLTVRDRVTELPVPIMLERSADRLVIRGELPLRQSAVGLTPFSVMMGALQVLDDMQLAFHIVAAR